MNLKVRMKNPAFWLALIPAVLLVVQVCAAPFGYEFDFGVLNQQLAAVVNAIFALLTVLGVAVDYTTEGIGDSELAMSYDEPAKRAKHAKID